MAGIRYEELGNTETDQLYAAHKRIAELEYQTTAPDGFSTWKDAAIDERVRRVASEKREQALTQEARYHQQEIDSLLNRLRKMRDELDVCERREQELVASLKQIAKASLDAIHYLPGGNIKAELRDAYDAIVTISLD